MIIFLYGPDSYRRQQKLKELTGGKNPRFFDLDLLSSIDSFKDFLHQKSMFFNLELGVVRGLFDIDHDLSAALADILELKDVVLIINETNEPRALYKFLLKKPVLSQNFNYLTGKGLREFVLEEAKIRGVNLTSQLLNKLVILYGNDTWAYITELDRLVFVSLDGEFTKTFGISGEDFFRILNGLKSESLTKRLSALEILFSNNEEPTKIFNILAAQKNLSTGWRTKFANYDLMIKSGKLEYEEVLLDFVLY